MWEQQQHTSEGPPEDSERYLQQSIKEIDFRLLTLVSQQHEREGSTGSSSI